ncbi:hypothetical protein [Kaistia soli]|nr:hypothetical protein [Kaistia soli]
MTDEQNDDKSPMMSCRLFAPQQNGTTTPICRIPRSMTIHAAAAILRR